MELPEPLAVVHQPARLRIMTLLYQLGDVGAAAARETTGLTAGNLDSHARRLCEAGLVESRKVLLRSGFEARYKITREGTRTMEAYLTWLESLVADLRVP